MTGDNPKKTVLVTGCSSGIGAYCARALRAEGWQVIASARTEADIGVLRAAGLEAFRLDYADPASIGEFFDSAMAATGGRCDALFNNGAYGQGGALEDLPLTRSGLNSRPIFSAGTTSPGASSRSCECRAKAASCNVHRFLA